MGVLPVQIVTPERIAWEGEADSVVVPAYDGLWGILPGHAPLLAQLTAGVVQIRRGDDVRTLVVSGGFVEVHEGRLSLFAETAEMAEEIDLERARQAAERARIALKSRGPAEDLGQAEASLRRALVRLRAAERMPRRPSARP
jgi:F-type H+-transporting ATPase subunit epsilon